jgi:hypothetical protein
MTMNTAQGFSPSGVKIEGAYENDRNATSSPLFKAILKEAYGVQDVIIGHHLIYVKEDKRADGFVYQIVEEVPSADALIFDHDIAKRIWGENFLPVLARLSAEPVATRDKLLAALYAARPAK